MGSNESDAMRYSTPNIRFCQEANMRLSPMSIRQENLKVNKLFVYVNFVDSKWCLVKLIMHGIWTGLNQKKWKAMSIDRHAWRACGPLTTTTTIYCMLPLSILSPAVVTAFVTAPRHSQGNSIQICIAHFYSVSNIYFCRFILMNECFFFIINACLTSGKDQ